MPRLSAPDAAGRTLRYHWDLLGRLRELHNENGSRYDPVGKLLEETGFDRKATEYRYDKASGVLAEVVEAGHRTRLAFDPLGRLSERQGEQAERFAYDHNGRSVEVINVASDDVEKTSALRQKVWALHSGKAEFCDGGDASPKAVKRAFDAWTQLLKDNAAGRSKGDAPTGFLFPFADTRTSSIRLS